MSSAGTASTTELSSIATIDSTTVSSEMIAIGTPNCTERLIVPTSRVTRVTRSPVLALSTLPSGSRRIVRTMNSRAGRQQVLAEQRGRALGEEGERRPAPARRRRSPAPAGRASGRRRRRCVLTSSPSSRGTTSPARGGERVEHDERRERCRGDATAGRGRRPAPRGCRPPASPARGCGRRRRRPRRAGGAGRGAPRRRATRSRRVASVGRDQLGGTTGGVEGAVAPGVGGGGEQVGHGETSSSASSIARITTSR